MLFLSSMRKPTSFCIKHTWHVIVLVFEAHQCYGVLQITLVFKVCLATFRWCSVYGEFSVPIAGVIWVSYPWCPWYFIVSALSPPLFSSMNCSALCLRALFSATHLLRVFRVLLSFILWLCASSVLLLWRTSPSTGIGLGLKQVLHSVHITKLGATGSLPCLGHWWLSVIQSLNDSAIVLRAAPHHAVVIHDEERISKLFVLCFLAV